MAQIILIEDNQIMNELITINLSTYLHVNIIQRLNAAHAINLLSILPNVELIICKSQIGSEQTAQDIYEYINKNKLNIGLIILGENKIISDNIISVMDLKDWQTVIQASAKYLGINDDIFTKKVTPDYIPVPVKYFLNLDSVNCDVFIKIKKSNYEFQYVKRIHNGDSFSKDSIKKYMEQGLEYFHISNENHRNFAIYVSNKLVQKLDSPYIDENQKIQIMGESYDIALKEISKLGFTSETIQLTDSIIMNMIKISEKSPEMSHLLHKVINSKTGVLYQHCHMTFVVAIEILKNLNMNDSDSYSKLSYASFFHDIMLADYEELTKINSFEELEKAQLEEEKWDLVFNHAFEASIIIRQHPEAPPGVDEIIKNHHGTSNGKGFSDNIEKLPDLSKIFIIAHHFVLELLLFKEKGGEARPITGELYKRFPGPSSLIIIKSLEKTLKRKRK